MNKAKAIQLGMLLVGAGALVFAIHTNWLVAVSAIVGTFVFLIAADFLASEPIVLLW